MYWTWILNSDNKTYISWGQPRSMPEGSFRDLKPDYSVKVYGGEEILPGQKMVMCMSGDATLGMGDSIWLMNFMKDVYHIKSRGRAEFHFCSSESINNFYSHFLPPNFNFREEYITKEEFDSFDHKLVSMYYWHDPVDNKDISGVDNKSILEHLYMNSGIEYCGLNDFGYFTSNEILHPSKLFYERLKINPQDKYVFFQWHSSGHCKNLPPKANIKLLRHITEKYGLKAYVIGRLNGLDRIEDIPGVINLSNRTTAEDVVSLAFNAEWLVGPDSACCHLGEAFRIPTVVIMSTLTPNYIASKYRIPTFMYGNGYCRYKPCGYVDKLPLDRCPAGTKKYCSVLEDVDLDLFDKCVAKSIDNRLGYRNKKPINFYDSQFQPISLI